MSYLLDALRRSERERQRAELPAAERVRMEMDQAATTPLRWRAGLLALLALNMAVAGWWWLRASPPEGPALAAIPSGPVAASVRPLAVPRAPTMPEPPSPPSVPGLPSPPSAAHPPSPPSLAASQPVESVAAPASPSRWPLLRNLPPATRASWPVMEISAQVYSPTNTQARFAIVNGEFLREGDAMSDGTALVEIFEESVLFERAGQRARVLVIDESP